MNNINVNAFCYQYCKELYLMNRKQLYGIILLTIFIGEMHMYVSCLLGVDVGTYDIIYTRWAVYACLLSSIGMLSSAVVDYENYCKDSIVYTMKHEVCKRDLFGLHVPETVEQVMYTVTCLPYPHDISFRSYKRSRHKLFVGELPHASDFEVAGISCIAGIVHKSPKYRICKPLTHEHNTFMDKLLDSHLTFSSREEIRLCIYFEDVLKCDLQIIRDSTENLAYLKLYDKKFDRYFLITRSPIYFHSNDCLLRYIPDDVGIKRYFMLPPRHIIFKMFLCTISISLCLGYFVFLWWIVCF